ncbi:NusG domain II-containing protein [uncultured Acetobacterium sp.]|uniref:NusG domain II-containing protein n=1 Tax=uncultured Acetobacterium sp. TaxID=217139 RepID=UPI0025FDFB6E|nr:NusG domain II-containing protein [uncultured Acetobacterium sp.]
MKKNEIIIILVLLASCLIGIAVFYLVRATDAPLSVRVTRQGTVEAIFPLSEDHTETFVDALGSNTLEISDGTAKIVEADCPDHICVRTYPISSPGETIVCLPHKLVVEVISSGESR